MTTPPAGEHHGQPTRRAAPQPWLQKRARHSGAPIAVLIVLAVIAGIFALLAGVEEPTRLLIALPSTAAAMALVLSYYFWLDRWEPEPARLLLLAFLWGATVAVAVSLVLEIATSHVLGDGAVRTIAAPAIEEAAKGAFLLVMLTGARRREFDGVVDGLVYAGFTAVGFAFIEDIGYVSQGLHESTYSGLATVVLRLVMAPFAHPLFTSMTGIGVGLAVNRPRSARTWLYPLLGYLAAVALHALWNGSLNYGLAGYLIVYVVIMVPVFIGAAFFARHQRRRERDILTAQLPAMVYYRWITSAEAGWLSTLAARRLWTRSVAARTGKAGAKALRRFQTAATELAFLRDRVQRGAGSKDAYYIHADLVAALGYSRAEALAPLHRYAPPVTPIQPVAPAFHQ